MVALHVVGSGRMGVERASFTTVLAVRGTQSFSRLPQGMAQDRQLGRDVRMQRWPVMPGLALHPV